MRLAPRAVVAATPRRPSSGGSLGTLTTDRTLVTGRIRVMDRPGNLADWMLVESGIVRDLGTGPAPDELSAGARALDLSLSCVLPGLHDTHVHLLGTGLMEFDLDLSRASTLDDVMEVLSDGARSRGGPVLRAHSFDPDLLSNGRYPTQGELDRVSRDVPIFVRRRDGHSSIVNSAAAALFELDVEAPGVELDDSGRPTGVLREDAHKAVAQRAYGLLSGDERRRCFELAARRAAERGIAVVHAFVGSSDPDNRDIELLLGIESGLPVDLVVYPQITDIERVVALGLPRIGGCLLLDGSLSSGTAAVSEPFADGDSRGVLYYTDERLVGFLRSAHARGLRIAMHAIGDRAIGQYLNCLETACGGETLAAGHIVEHCELVTPEQIAKMALMGVAVGAQPTFEHLWGGPGRMYEARLGRERAAGTNPLRTMIEAGVLVAGGSDSYVTPMDSLLGVHSAVNHPNESERLTRLQAVSLFTANAARLSSDETRVGTLEVGKEATFAVLDSDPFDIEADRIKDIGVEGLYIRGVRVDARPA